MVVMSCESLSAFTSEILRPGTRIQVNHSRCKPVKGGGNKNSDEVNMTKQSAS
jgi:hypothetical protein